MTSETLKATSSEVDAFLAKWKPLLEKEGFTVVRELILETNAVAKTLGALDRDPTGPWGMCLQFLVEPAGRITNATAAVAVWRQARASLERAGARAPQNSDIADNLLMVNQTLAQAHLEAGQLKEAVSGANALLAQNRKGWNYGNIIYDAHTVLGRAALRQGDLKEASKELLKAGETPGSPQLNSFGPNFALARELLERGEKEVVIKFLDQVARFWSAAENRKKLETWKQEIAAGKVPTGPNWH